MIGRDMAQMTNDRCKKNGMVKHETHDKDSNYRIFPSM